MPWYFNIFGYKVWGDAVVSVIVIAALFISFIVWMFKLEKKGMI